MRWSAPFRCAAAGRAAAEARGLPIAEGQGAALRAGVKRTNQYRTFMKNCISNGNGTGSPPALNN